MRQMVWSRSCLPLVVLLGVGTAGCSLMTCPCPKQKPTPVPAAIGPLSAGAASVTITPVADAPLAGFGDGPRRNLASGAAALFIATALAKGTCTDPDPSTRWTQFAANQGTLDPVMARALVLSNTHHKIGIVKVDTIGSSRKLRDDLLSVAGALGIDDADFIVLATHTHSGPGAVSEHLLWQIAAVDCFSQAMYDAVLQAATSALQQADAALQPALLGIGTTTETQASENRSGRFGIYDDEIGLVKVTTPSGTPLAALFNFAVHGTSLGDANLQMSADCMGAMEQVIETGLPGAVAIFTNGAEGDVRPKYKGLAGLQQEGTLVGDDVLALWPTVATKSSIDLRGAFQDVKMPPPSWNSGMCLPVFGTNQTLCDIANLPPLMVPLDPSWLSTTLPFQAIRIDDTVFVGIPGEPITEIGWELKARAHVKGFARGFVFALANDHGSYFTTPAEYQRGAYEGQSTLYGPTTGQVVIDSAAGVMSLVQ